MQRTRLSVLLLRKTIPYAVTTVHNNKPKQEKKIKCMNHVYRTQSAPVPHHPIMSILREHYVPHR